MKTVACLLLACALAFGAYTLRAQSSEVLYASESYEDMYYLPPSGWLPWLSLGYDEAFADAIWIRALLYYGEQLKQHGEVQFAAQYIDGLLTLNPNFRRVYPWASTAMLYQTSKTSKAEVLAAVRLLKRGVEQFPDDGELAWEYGAVLAYELPPFLDSAEERDAAKAEAAEHFVVATRTGHAPEWLTLTTVGELETTGRTQQAIAHLEEMYARVADESTRQRIATRLGSLRNAAYADTLRAQQEEFHTRWAEDFGYVPTFFYPQIGRPTEVLVEPLWSELAGFNGDGLSQ